MRMSQALFWEGAAGERTPDYVHFTNKQKLIASECQQNLSWEYILLSNATCSRTGLLWITAKIKEHLCINAFPPAFASQDRLVFLITLSAEWLLLIVRRPHLSPSSSHITAVQSPRYPSALAAPGNVTSSKWQLTAGSTPHIVAAAREILCQGTDQHLQFIHWFPLATANKGQVRCRTALISYKLKLITIIMKGCRNTEFAPFAVVFMEGRLVR